MTHDYKRNGTTTLFAPFNVLDGLVIAQFQQRHRHVKWLCFLRQIDRETSKDKTLRLICDNTPHTNIPTCKRALRSTRVSIYISRPTRRHG